MRDLAEQYSLQAAVYGVWRAGKGGHDRCLDTALPGVPATDADHFRIGNVTEALTTTLLLQLVDRGKISLDDKLSKWYPSVPYAEEITVEMLASSTSGYVHYVNEQSLLDAFHADVFATWMPDEVIQYGVGQPLLFPPGTSWEFSDTNFVLLGEIVRRVGGAPVRTQIKQRIVKPLGMPDTQTSTTTVMPSPVLHGVVGCTKAFRTVACRASSWRTAGDGCPR